MRKAVTARVALLATAVVLSVSAAAGPPVDPPPVPAAAASPLEAFRSVRSYAAVAEPVRLRIPAIGVNSVLVQLGRAPNRSIEVPVDYQTAGWFDDGPRPGEPGPAVMLGHVDSKAGPGVFYGLVRLTAGADVLVDRADGSTIRFRVRSTLRVPKSAFPTDLVYAPTLEPALRLVTCGGGFDRARGSYLDNVIVYADPIA